MKPPEQQASRRCRPLVDSRTSHGTEMRDREIKAREGQLESNRVYKLTVSGVSVG